MIEDACCFSWLLSATAVCNNVILRAEYLPFKHRANRISVHALASRLFDSVEYGMQWHAFDDESGQFVPVYSKEVNGADTPNMSEVIFNFLHGAYRVKLFFP